MVMKVLLHDVELARTGNRVQVRCWPIFLGSQKSSRARSHFRFILWKRPLGSLCYWLFHFWRKKISPWVKWGEHWNTAPRAPNSVYWAQDFPRALSVGAGRRVVSPWRSYWGLLEAAGRGQRWPGVIGGCGPEVSSDWGCRLYDLGHVVSFSSFLSAVKWGDVLL